MAEVKAGNHSDEAGLDLALNKLSSNQRELLWKKFEQSRHEAGDEQQQVYMKATAGKGGTAKKRALLRSWLWDGGKCKGHFKEALQALLLKSWQDCHVFRLYQSWQEWPLV